MRNFWRLMTLFAPAWLPMLAACLLAVLTIAGNIGLMATAAYLISTAALYPPLSALSPAIAGVRFFGLLRAVSRYLERFVAHDATFRLLARIRIAVYSALEPLPPAVLAGFRGGELFNRVMSDVETLQYFYLKVLLPPIVALLVLVGMVVFIASFSTDLAILLFCSFAFTGLVVPYWLYRVRRDAGGDLSRSQEELTTILAESLAGMRDLLSFNEENRQMKRAVAADAAFSLWQARTVAYHAWAQAGGNLLMSSTVAAALMLTIPLLQTGQLEGVYLAALALAIQSSFEGVLPLTAFGLYQKEASSAASRIFAILDAAPCVADDENDENLPVDYSLTAENVTFCYQEDRRPAIDGISFELPAGKRMALVGPSGAGKSSLVSLLARFWEYETGSIFLGGKEIRRYHPDTLRNAIGIVMQDDYLFHATLAENIRLSRPSASAAETFAAAEQAALGAVIGKLPAGLETLVGENGYGLSGGERRKVLIARAILKNAPILVLDEPTAGLDPLTEREMMKMIYETTKGKTLLLITHRLTALQGMDEILVMDQGRIVERGSQSELLARQGLFHQMWRLQNDIFPSETVQSMDLRNMPKGAGFEENFVETML